MRGLISHACRTFPILAILGASTLCAHRALYHDIEVNLTEPHVLRFYFTLHEPDVGEADPVTYLDSHFAFIVDGQPAALRYSFDHDSEDVPESCFLGVAELENPGGELRVQVSPQSQKRLMLTVVRPRAFPETQDLAAGDEGLVSLPEPLAESAPPASMAERDARPPFPWALVVLSAGVIVLIAWRRFGKQSSSRSA